MLFTKEVWIIVSDVRCYKKLRKEKESASNQKKINWIEQANQHSAKTMP